MRVICGSLALSIHTFRFQKPLQEVLTDYNALAAVDMNSFHRSPEIASGGTVLHCAIGRVINRVVSDDRIARSTARSPRTSEHDLDASNFSDVEKFRGNRRENDVA